MLSKMIEDRVTFLFGMTGWRIQADRLVSVMTVLFVALAGAAITMRLTKNYLRGDMHGWQQGDWLINRNLVDIRRGHIGSWLLDLADLFAISPLTVVFILHAVLVAVLFYLLARVFLLIDQPLILAPFVLSPALFVIFWLPWHEPALRKETLAFLALFMTLLACIKSSRRWLVAGAALLSLSVYGHEANILFMPVYLAVLWLCRKTVPRGFTLWASLIFTFCAALHAFWYAMRHSQLEDIALVCRPLLDRGAHPDLCDGAIFWLTQDTSDAMFLLSFLYDPSHLILLGIVCALALIPLLFVLGHLENHRVMMALALLAVFSFVPLFFIAVDWGRWISMQVFSLMILTMAALWSGETVVRRAPPPTALVVIMGLSLLWVPNVTMEYVSWLWYQKIFSEIAEILS